MIISLGSLGSILFADARQSTEVVQKQLEESEAKRKKMRRMLVRTVAAEQKGVFIFTLLLGSS